MRVLILTDHIHDLNKVTCYTDVWTHFLIKQLRVDRHEVHIEPLHLINEKPIAGIENYFKSMPLHDAEHIIALGLRYFTRLPKNCGAVLKDRIGSGQILQLADRALSGQNPVWTMHAAGPEMMLNFRIGWAADPDLCYPEQDNNELRILIDHPHYNGQDYSTGITQQVADFVSSGGWKDKFSSVRVRRLIDGGVEDVSDVTAKPFSRKHVPYPEACAEYRKAHVFIPTHVESVGLVALEAAMAGAMVLCRKGFIVTDRLDTVRHIDYQNKIDWASVLSSIDPQKSHEFAKKQNWPNVVDRINKFFRSGK